jgi:hypothetical protein
MRRFAFALALLSATIADAEEPQAWSFCGVGLRVRRPRLRGLRESRLSPPIAGAFHLEARYNYEALDTASVWGGANFSTGETWLFDSTVMLGAVFGDFDGVAPGFRLSLTRSWFELTSEGEYYFDFHDHEENYLYSWTEIAGYPTEWFRAGSPSSARAPTRVTSRWSAASSSASRTRASTPRRTSTIRGDPLLRSRPVLRVLVHGGRKLVDSAAAAERCRRLNSCISWRAGG